MYSNIQVRIKTIRYSTKKIPLNVHILHQRRSVFNFSDIQCVVTLYNFPRISRQLNKRLPDYYNENIVISIFVHEWYFKHVRLSQSAGAFLNFLIFPKI